jgi:hypothetical protein
MMNSFAFEVIPRPFHVIPNCTLAYMNSWDSNQLQGQEYHATTSDSINDTLTFFNNSSFSGLFKSELDLMNGNSPDNKRNVVTPTAQTSFLSVIISSLARASLFESNTLAVSGLIV